MAMDLKRAETEIRTPQASIYLQQLCKHWSHKFAVTFTPLEGRIPFDNVAVCSLRAADGVLHLTVDAPADKLERMKGVVFSHLKRFAHREELAEPVWRGV